MDIKVISWNIRGLNAFERMVALKNLVMAQKCTICLIQDTKMMKMDHWVIQNILYDGEFDWMYFPSVGASGGLLTVWDKSKLVKEGERVRMNNISTLFTLKDNWDKLVVCNLYSPCEYTEREVFRKDLEEIKNWWEGPMCYGGDVNAVRSNEERNRGDGDSRNNNFLNNFIYNQELVDLPLLGGAFTWSDMQTDPLLCRLDRFMLIVGFDVMFPDDVQMTLARVISDHKPMLISKPGLACKPYFKFENGWIYHKQFKQLVEQWWGMMNFEGSASFIFFKKLQNLKYLLNNWSREEFGGVKREKNDLT
ncbi:uncharacterized protein LOC113294624 [Papaver somniferum]|uniref:uncharacterized protein LOC113294624 n=1 Tax=Papaver somniferum TaxID=3469 RepID=UPI000E6FA732|nr:uncharacterized protein LOC113294624 [Papaver somniferum]